MANEFGVFSSNFDIRDEETEFLSEKLLFKILDEGDNYVRLIGPFIFRQIHYVPNAKLKYIICCGDNCPLCEMGNTPRLSYYVNIYDRSDGKVKILRFGRRMRKMFYNLYRKYGDLSKYDVIITREGTGLETVYSVMPAPPTENLTLNPETIKYIKENYINLEEIFKIPTPEEIKKLLEGGGNDVELNSEESIMEYADDSGEEDKKSDSDKEDKKSCFGTAYNPIHPKCVNCKFVVECKEKTIKQFEE